MYPNGFSPNGDGINETYVVPCNEEHLKNGPTSLKVYNRWGDEVWRSLGNYQNDFAGKNQQTITLPDGTYYFIYKYVNAAGKEESVAKFMVIHRE
jgi:gliding motility-associated-like protein